MQIIQIDETLVNILIKATRDGLAMANVKPVPVGVSRYVTNSRYVSAVIGLVGHTSGAIMVSAGANVTQHLASNLLGETYTDLTPDVLDSICEIGNIIAGQTKALLSQTEWKLERISCPSVVVGSSYFISHYKGMHTAAVEFELTEMPLAVLDDRIFSVSISLMKV